MTFQRKINLKQDIYYADARSKFAVTLLAKLLFTNSTVPWTLGRGQSVFFKKNDC